MTSGVGVGDFNNDGLQDLVFSGNQVGSKLYLNKGNLEFDDITSNSGFLTVGWATGVSIVDINTDGLDDIYISIGGLDCNGQCNNQLFINQGINAEGKVRFEERAADYNLDDGMYNQQAAFLDYDQDGDLDVFLLHNVIDRKDKNAPFPKRYTDIRSQDQLLRNDYNKELGHPVYVDVSEEAAVTERGFGLGLAIHDLNQDGLPDIYVANDFISDDDLYINQGDGTFKESSPSILKHQSHNAMGVDIADLTGDGLSEIVVLDMLPAYHERQKTMLGIMNYSKYQMTQREGYASQYMRNTLQKHNGFLGDTLVPMSEVGYLAGIHKTDWSWAPLIADFDNDGLNDLYITNGYGKDITDLDFISYTYQSTGFGSAESYRQKQLEAVNEMQEISMANYFYKNNSNLSFDDASKEWGAGDASISNGTAYVDLDNDGDLDLVTNNINQAAFVLENKLGNGNYLNITLKGAKDNPDAYGSSIEVWQAGEVQRVFHNPIRGYLSSVSQQLHFGLGNINQVDSLMVRWPKVKGQGSYATSLYTVEANQTLTIDIKEADITYVNEQLITTTLLESKTVEELPIVNASTISDFDLQPLMLSQQSGEKRAMAYSHSTQGKRGLLFIGGGLNEAGVIYSTQGDGHEQLQVLNKTSTEDVDAVWVDVNNDQLEDLYVVAGGGTSGIDNKSYQDRLYIQYSTGRFELSDDLLPQLDFKGSCVAAEDYDKDGDVDLFVGGYPKASDYPQRTKSVLLKNNGGRYMMSAEVVSEEFVGSGCITDAIWADVDGDNWKELVTGGAWMPLNIMKNNNGVLKTTPYIIEDSEGLWNCIVAQDIDRDGDIDLVAGNHGLNSNLNASNSAPLMLNSADLDNNGSLDPIVGRSYLNRAGDYITYPLHSRDDIMRQLPSLKNRYSSYSEFSDVAYNDIIQDHKEAQLEAKVLANSIFVNDGTGNFKMEILPQDCQLSSVSDIILEDFNNDDLTDLLLLGNDYTAESNGGRHDASNGVILIQSKEGGYKVVSTAESGVLIEGDMQGFVHINRGRSNTQLLVSQTGRKWLSFKIRNFAW